MSNKLLYCIVLKRKRSIEPIFPLRIGFTLLIIRLSLRSSSETEGDEDNILKSEKEMGWPVSMWWERILVGEGLTLLLPVKGEIPI